ncbi:MAG TPA: hypothetical protein VKG26_11355 [Bacteroidia bacterium]|nr:hypothetical protein [Bacteroidia bacterium]
MKNKKTKSKRNRDAEILCDNLILQQQVKKLQAHLQALLNTLDFVLNERLNK